MREKKQKKIPSQSRRISTAFAPGRMDVPTSAKGDRPPDGPSDDTSDRTVLALIRDLRSGAVSGNNLSTGDRQRCVEHLIAEGLSSAEIADILKVTERTVYRDKKQIRSANALHPDPGFIPERVGELVRHAESTVNRVLRLARERETPPAVRMECERVSWQVMRECTQLLQSLGYLPKAAQEFKGELTHTLVDEAPECDELQAELERLTRIAGDGASVPESARARLTLLQAKVERLTIQQETHQLTAALTQGGAHAPHAPLSEISNPNA